MMRSNTEICEVDMPWGMCGQPAVSKIEAPTEHEGPLYLCQHHKKVDEALTELLSGNPEIKKELAEYLDKAYRDTAECND